MTEPLADLDPFDLPDWLGEGAVTWAAETGVRRGHRIAGHLTGAGPEVPCDLLAVDEAHPAPVADGDPFRLHRLEGLDQAAERIGMG